MKKEYELIDDNKELTEKERESLRRFMLKIIRSKDPEFVKRKELFDKMVKDKKI